MTRSIYPIQKNGRSSMFSPIHAAFALTILVSPLVAEEPIEPEKPVDYGKIAFYPKRWAENKVDPHLTPWSGNEIVFLTAGSDFDRKIMTKMLERLDGGWELYARLTGKRPRTFKHLLGQPTIAAVPKGNLSCGIGCGYIGATGIEVAGFYGHDYKMLQRDIEAMPHYYFYEMGRNFYTFGPRHSLFITGFAVFMRYVCMDTLKCHDPEKELRRKIDLAEAQFAESDMSFLKGFTTKDGLGEKAPRLKNDKGKHIHPSDQPVIYASAMLKLWRDHGGNEWLKRFYRELAGCEPVPPKTKEDAIKQSLIWMVAASCAAKEDLSPVFADRWRMPMSPVARKKMAAINWEEEGLSAAKLMKEVMAVD